MRPEDGCLLLDKVLLWFENAILELNDDGLKKMRKNPYKYNVQLMYDDGSSSKLSWKFLIQEV